MSIPQDVWRRAPYGVCGLVSCSSCEHFVKGRCPACVRGNAATARRECAPCAIYECVKGGGAESCRECRSDHCLVLESRADGDLECGLAERLGLAHSGSSLLGALRDLRSARETGACADLAPRLVRRLPAYLMALQELAREGVETVVSAELALRVGTSAALVRKDLSSVGTWGRRSAGYRVGVLSENLRRAAGLDELRQAAWLGCKRLAKYPRLIEEFRAVGCAIAAAFCEEGRHVGRHVNGLIIKPAKDLPLLAKELDLSVAIVAVDDDRAQAAAELAAGAGVRSILNLTNKILLQPRGASVENVSPLQGLVSLLLRAPGAEGKAEGASVRRERSS
ncbi:MAG TPA: redox-sensing transcriptional repressor Rex [Armatimonadota bacterium]|nr:redox-sensing transcriptional repressor Rex [Armatimonadota bacterium]